jgi:hypothetical protein
MGLEVVIPRSDACPLGAVLELLAAAGLPTTIAMVDNALVRPTAPPPAEWREVRLRTPAGMITLRRQPGGIALLVFGNADAALQAAQRQVADAVRAAPA